MALVPVATAQTNLFLCCSLLKEELLFEPCVLEDSCVSLPVELFALSLNDLTSTIFTPEVWNSLDTATRAQLMVRSH